MSGLLVSIVIPTYNRSWGLRRALRSVLAQSFDDLEVIVADDCSIDDTPGVIAELRDPRVRYHRQERNVGVSRNWGAGLALSRGTFVCFLMDDDWYEPGFLARRAEALRAAAAITCVFGGFRRVNPDGTEQQPHCPGLPGDRALSEDEFFRAALSRSIFIGSAMYRADIVKSLWPEIEAAGLIVDYALNTRLALLPGARARFLPGIDFAMSCHPEQLSNARRAEVCRAVAAFLEGLLAAPDNPERHRLIRRELASWHLLQGVRARQRGERAAALAHLAASLRRGPTRVAAWKQVVRAITGF
jgi:glycosyltransferase involved in cell wall biosynthesis